MTQPRRILSFVVCLAALLFAVASACGERQVQRSLERLKLSADDL